MSPERPLGDVHLLLRLLREARAYWPHVLGLFVLHLLATPLSLLAPVPLKLVVDSVLGDEAIPEILTPLIPQGLTTDPFRLLVAVALFAILIEVASRARSLAASLLRSYAGERLVMQFRSRLFRHSQRLSVTYHDRAGSSDAIYRIQYDAGAIQYIAIDGVIPLVAAVVSIVGMFYVVTAISWPLALLALTILPLLGILTALFRDPLRRRWKAVKKLESSSLQIVQEVHGALRVVQAFGREEHEQRRYEDQYQEGYRARLGVTFQQGLFDVSTGLIMATGMAAALFVGTRDVLAGTLTLGNLLLVMSYLGQLSSPIKTLGGKFVSMQNNMASAERAFELLDRNPDVVERPGARSLARARGEIEFRDVAFAYEPGAPVLGCVSFRVEPGEKIGVVGETGSGKSTLMGLVTRFYDATEGSVLLDGHDLREYKLADLRDQFAIVLQDTVLFSAPILENIAYGKPGASEEEVIRAARAASAHEFIESLPEGYDTMVGERGMRLSGGERQRIALARAFLKDAPILILDEPTSSVDVKTEALIIDAMSRLMSGRTTFMIAHRLVTLSGCDRVFEVEGSNVNSRATVSRP